MVGSIPTTGCTQIGLIPTPLAKGNAMKNTAKRIRRALLIGCRCGQVLAATLLAKAKVARLSFSLRSGVKVLEEGGA